MRHLCSPFHPFFRIIPTTTWNSKVNQFFIWLAINWMIPNFCMGNGWKSPFPSIFTWLALGYQEPQLHHLQKPTSSTSRISARSSKALSHCRAWKKKLRNETKRQATARGGGSMNNLFHWPICLGWLKKRVGSMVVYPPIGRKNTTYIPLIYCLPRGYMLPIPPFTGTISTTIDWMGVVFSGCFRLLFVFRQGRIRHKHNSRSDRVLPPLLLHPCIDWCQKILSGTKKMVQKNLLCVS